MRGGNDGRCTIAEDIDRDITRQVFVVSVFAKYDEQISMGAGNALMYVFKGAC